VGVAACAGLTAGMNAKKSKNAKTGDNHFFSLPTFPTNLNRASYDNLPKFTDKNGTKPAKCSLK
jgi:hypothetical protein